MGKLLPDNSGKLHFSTRNRPKIEKHYVRVAALPLAGQISEKNGARPDLGTSRALKYCK